MKNLMIYYGWLNSFNSAQNSWNNEKVAQDLARYDVLVFGDGLADPTHGDYSNTQVIIPRIKVLNPHAKIFGYVSINQTLSNFETKVDDWNDLEIDGIFCDEAGYDFGTTSTNDRKAFNEKIDHIHSRSYAKIAFVNAWKPEHVLTTENDASYPNTTWNPDLHLSNLWESDWYLMESHGIKTDKTFEAHNQWQDRGDKIQEIIADKPIKVAAVSVVDDADSNGQDKFDFVYHSALAWNFDAVGVSDTSFGASSAKGKFWDRPDIGLLKKTIGVDKVVQQGTTGIHLCYKLHGKIKIDFTASSEASSLELY